MTSLYDPTREEISAILEGEPSYRLNQLWSGLYTHFKKPADISNLPAALRTKIDAELPESLIEVQRSTSEDGDTVKFCPTKTVKRLIVPVHEEAVWVKP